MGWGGGGGTKAMARIVRMESSVKVIKIILIHFYFCELAVYEKPEVRRIPDASQAANVQCRGSLSLPIRKLQRKLNKNETGKRGHGPFLTLCIRT